MSEIKMSSLNSNLVDEILKFKKDVHFLAHFYEEGEVQDLADSIGDSFQLAKAGQETNKSTILMCGVVFMAESVKILNPNKKVIVPDLGAGCSLVEESPYEKFLEWRLKHPTAIAVTYINSSALVKSISDVIVTSSNAKKIIESIPKNRQILFAPDKNLGRWLSQTLKRDMILWPGSCQVHILFSIKKILQLKAEHPQALVLAHPECNDDVLSVSDVIGSTSRLLEEVTKNPAKQFIVATEPGIIHQMKKARPDAEIYEAPSDNSCGCNNCPYMKLNTLNKIYNCLVSGSPEIQLPPELMTKALVPLQRMMDISSGQPVVWPERFFVTGQPK